MTFLQLKTMLQEDFNRKDKETVFYPLWINRALKQIQRDHSYTCMRSRTNLTISSGNSSANLPSNFKELLSERRSIFLSSGVPVSVESRENIKVHDYMLTGSVSNASEREANGKSVFIESDSSGQWSLNITSDAAEDLVYDVAFYGFLADLSDDSDSNFFTNNYPTMLEHKIKSIAFGSINDPLAGDFEAFYREERREAIRQDKASKLKGRKLRMGG